MMTTQEMLNYLDELVISGECVIGDLSPVVFVSE